MNTFLSFKKVSTLVEATQLMNKLASLWNVFILATLIHHWPISRPSFIRIHQ